MCVCASVGYNTCCVLTSPSLEVHGGTVEVQHVGLPMVCKTSDMYLNRYSNSSYVCVCVRM